MMYKAAVTKLILYAIHQHCISCCGGCRNDVSFCDYMNCSLYPYRMRKVPKEISRNAEALLAAAMTGQKEEPE